MKLWEVLKALGEGSTAIYKAVYEDGDWVTMTRIGNYPEFTKYLKDGTKCDQQARHGYFSGNCRLSADWQEIKQPVPWQEALEAWVNGKTIKCEMGVFELLYEGDAPYLETEGDTIFDRVKPDKDMFKNGVWYIED